MIKDDAINGQHDFIRAYQLEDPILDEIIDFYNQNESEHFEGCVATDNSYGVIDKNYKESTDCHMTGDLLHRYINGYLQKSLDIYMEEYPELASMNKFSVNSPVNIQKYEPSQGFKAWHCERGGTPTQNRIMFWITYLNDVSDAGETEFLHQKLKVKSKRGLTLLAPVDWMYTHRGVPSPTETKMIATGWYTFDPPEWKTSLLRKRRKHK